jgi:hypothetical protein
LFELRSSNNGGSPIIPVNQVSILPSINQSEKVKKKQKEKKTTSRIILIVKNKLIFYGLMVKQLRGNFDFFSPKVKWLFYRDAILLI